MNLITRKRGLASLMLVGASALVLAGCGAAPEESGTDAPEEVDFLACAVSDEGDFEDASFNQAAYEGLEKAEAELGIEIEGLTSATAEAFEPNLTQLVADGCDIIFAIGFNFSLGGENGVIFDFAAANPEQKFAWLDGWPGPENLQAIVYKSEEGAYLGGYVAAAYSKTHTIGTYGGAQIDSVTAFMDGYVAGAAAYDAEFGTTTTVLGWDPATATGDFVGNFQDTTVAGAISDNQIAQGADVIFPVAGDLFKATATSIENSGKDVVMLGVDKNIANAEATKDLAPVVLTSVEKRMTQAVFDIIKEAVEGNYTDVPYVGTLANDGTGLSPFYDFDGDIPQEVKDGIAALTEQIINGDIVIPLTTNPQS